MTRFYDSKTSIKWLLSRIIRSFGRFRHRARQPPRHLPLAHRAGGGHEPVQVRRGARPDLQAASAAPPTTRRASPGPCSTASICRSKCPPYSAADLVLPPPSEGSAEVRARVSAARELQRTRFAALGARGVRTNAECSGALLEQIAMPDEAGVALLRPPDGTLLGRGFHRTEVAQWPISDGAEKVAGMHVAEGPRLPRRTLRQQRAA